MTTHTHQSAPPVKSPGVPVKVLITLAEIKPGGVGWGAKGGGAAPRGRRLQTRLVFHQLGLINHFFSAHFM